MNLSNNKHLKEVEKTLDNWDDNKGYLTTNDIHGVDLVAEINIEELNLDTEDKDEIAEALELHYDGSDYYFRRSKDDYMEFALDTNNLGDEVSIHFDLYNDRTKAPFSHDANDAQSDPPPPQVSESATILLVGFGLIGLSGFRNRFKKYRRIAQHARVCHIS